MSKPASTAVMAQLHAVLAQVMLDILKNGVIVGVDPEGGELRRNANAAEMGVVVTFLKNNSITSDIEQDEALREMNDMLRNKAKQHGLTMPDTLQ